MAPGRALQTIHPAESLRPPSSFGVALEVDAELCDRLDIKTLTDPYDDPHHQPPADIRGSEARVYEQKIVEMLRDRLLPSSGQVKVVRSIELRGERPDTEIIFRYTDTRDGSEHARRAVLWRDSWPTDGAAEFGRLHDPASVAGWLLVAWQAGELEAVHSA